MKTQSVYAKNAATLMSKKEMAAAIVDSITRESMSLVRDASRGIAYHAQVSLRNRSKIWRSRPIFARSV